MVSFGLHRFFYTTSRYSTGPFSYVGELEHRRQGVLQLGVNWHDTRFSTLPLTHPQGGAVRVQGQVSPGEREGLGDAKPSPPLGENQQLCPGMGRGGNDGPHFVGFQVFWQLVATFLPG